MNSYLYLDNSEVTFDMTTYDEETGKPWYVLKVREGLQTASIFINHDQLRDLTGMAVNAMMTACPTEDFMSAGPIEATYEATDAGVAALTELRCDHCGERVTTRLWLGGLEYAHIAKKGYAHFLCSGIALDDGSPFFATVLGTTHADENANVTFK